MIILIITLYILAMPYVVLANSREFKKINPSLTLLIVWVLLWPLIIIVLWVHGLINLFKN